MMLQQWTCTKRVRSEPTHTFRKDRVPFSKRKRPAYLQRQVRLATPVWSRGSLWLVSLVIGGLILYFQTRTANAQTNHTNTTHGVVVETYTQLKALVEDKGGPEVIRVNASISWPYDTETTTGDGTIIIARSVQVIGMCSKQRCVFDAKEQCRHFYVESVVNITFANLELINGNAYLANGGAVHFAQSARGNALIENCAFVRNIAGQGGAIYSAKNDVELTFRGSAFEANQAKAGSENAGSGWGGAVFLWSSSATFDDCDFVRNKASWRCGAVYVWCSAKAVFYETAFTENSGMQYGGAIVADHGIIECYNCTFAGNSVLLGGGMGRNCHAFSAHSDQPARLLAVGSPTVDIAPGDVTVLGPYAFADVIDKLVPPPPPLPPSPSPPPPPPPRPPGRGGLEPMPPMPSMPSIPSILPPTPTLSRSGGADTYTIVGISVAGIISISCFVGTGILAMRRHYSVSSEEKQDREEDRPANISSHSVEMVADMQAQPDVEEGDVEKEASTSSLDTRITNGTTTTSSMSKYSIFAIRGSPTSELEVNLGAWVAEEGAEKGLTLHDYGLERIASGSYGAVFPVMYYGQGCAMKCIEYNSSDSEPEADTLNGAFTESQHARASAKSEIMIADMADHPNLVRTFATYIYRMPSVRRDHAVLVQEMCDGKSVKSHIQDGILYQDCSSKVQIEMRKIDVCRQVLMGLQFLHTHGVIHSDVKASNVFLRSEVPLAYPGYKWRYTAKLGDFGHSIILEKGESIAIANRLGTITHAAPELASEGTASAASDTFAYGRFIWEVLQARDVWHGVPEASAREKAQRGEPLRFDDDDEHPFVLIRLCHDCCSRDKDDRPHTAEGFNRINEAWKELLRHAEAIDHAQGPPQVGQKRLRVGSEG